MQFVEMVTTTDTMTGLIRQIPETWWKDTFGNMQTLFGYLHDSTNMEVLSRLASEISTRIGRDITNSQPFEATKKRSYPSLTNCMISEEKLITFAIPLIFETDAAFYQLRVSPAGLGGASGKQKMFRMSWFYPREHGAVRWYAKFAAWLTYYKDCGKDMVVVDGEHISVKAWNAVCALMVAQGVNDGGDAGIIMDMARDQII